jgi:AcrR family transcriptional regulator
VDSWLQKSRLDKKAADVSTTTLFKHFTGKEALVFDEEQHKEAALVAAVRQRAAGQSVVDALRQYVLTNWLAVAGHPQAAEFMRLVDSTPALNAYHERMWSRHTDALSAAIAAEFGVDPDDVACVALARFVLEIPGLTRSRPDRRAAVDTIFDLLARGWVDPPAGARNAAGPG